MKLYEIANQYQEAFNVLSDMDDMPEEAIRDTLEGLEGEFKDKGLAVASYFQNLEAEAKAIKDAENRMALRRKAIDNKIARMKDYLKLEMEATGITEISCPHFQLKINKNPPSVIIDDEDLIPDEYKKTKTVTTIDKLAIKKAKGCEGAHLQTGTRLVIK